ncbi:hypothetical protein JCM3770_006934 [Rhodotorula araucariae]
MPHAPFDLLPDELVFHIVDLLEPVANGPEWPSRYSLGPICLVSRRFCRLVQPLLWRKVVVKAGPKMATFTRKTPQRLAAAVRNIVILATAGHHLAQPPLKRLLRTLPHVEEVEVFGSADIEMDVFEHAHNLKRLAGPAGLRATQPFLLPHLENITVPPSSAILRHLTSTTVPALRVVIFDTVNFGPSNAVEFDMSILPQLEYLQANWPSAARFEDVYRPRSSAVVLARFTYWDLFYSHIPPAIGQLRHVSLGQLDYPRSHNGIGDTLLDMLERCHGLKTLTLPRDFVEVEKLLKYASVRGVKIVWSDTRHEPRLDGAFYEYAKELRARGEV